MKGAVIAVAASLAACSNAAKTPPPYSQHRGGAADVSRAADADMIAIPAGEYIAGSTTEQRERAYQVYRETAGHDAARRGNWFDVEREPHQGNLPSYVIDRTHVTNAAYAEFVADTGIAPPFIDARTWKRQGFSPDYDTEVARFNWDGATPPEGREQHPVLLVAWNDAAAYCAWRGSLVGASRRLPTAAEFEKAARGTQGANYPWGDRFDSTKLNSAVGGPGDTVPVGSYPEGASPFGVLDAAGNAFHWTATPWPHDEPGEMTVKGSGWEDYGGVGRGASAHGRPPDIRHAIIGFRCAGG